LDDISQLVIWKYGFYTSYTSKAWFRYVHIWTAHLPGTYRALHKGPL